MAICRRLLISALILTLIVVPGRHFGGVDDASAGGGCDGGTIAIDSSAPLDAAKALGICTGLQSASWLLPDGAGPPTAAGPAAAYHLGHGIKSSFGTNVAPQEGSYLLVLSTGRARTPADADPCNASSCLKNYSHSEPTGFDPVVPQGCPTPSSTANDGIALKVTVQVPQGVTGFSFDWTHYAFEYPEWLCSQFNDSAAVMVDGVSKLIDSAGGTVGTNSPLTVCTGCSQGTAELVGTGFDVWDDAGATGWNTTVVSVTAGTTHDILFAIWDAGDDANDSTILFDNWQWLGDADGDTVTDAVDNCPAVANLDQANNDTDPQGDACDLDDDNDGYTDADEVAFTPDENPILYCATMRADVNHDGVVTIGDLAAVAGAFLQSPPANPRLDQGETPDDVITIVTLPQWRRSF